MTRISVWVAFGMLAASLAVLAVTPVLVSMRTRALRMEITEVAEPTISAVAGIERALALELAALRGYSLHGDTTFLSRYRRLAEEEAREMRRLKALAGTLDSEVLRHAERLDEMLERWHGDIADRLSGSAQTARSDIGALDPEPLIIEAAGLRRSVELLERLRREDIAATERFEIWLNRVMIVLVAIAGVALALIGRRLHALAASSEAQRGELEREVNRRARLVRGISHDLKNPLGVADAHAEFLESGIKGPLTADQQASVGAIRRSVRNTVRLIEDLLQLARAERGEIPLAPVAVDFTELVAAAAEDTRSSAEARDLRLRAVLPAERLEGVADPRRVREIVDNLLSNAIRYTPAGGEVTLGVVSTSDDSGDGARIRISVSDTGPGVAPADAERIFQEFERAASTEEGSGLGLAISREMAQLMGGEIELESRVGHGSTFTLVLPRNAAVIRSAA